MKSPATRITLAIILAAAVVTAGLLVSSAGTSKTTSTFSTTSASSATISAISTPITVTRTVISNSTLTDSASAETSATSHLSQTLATSQTSQSASCVVTGTGGPLFVQILTDAGSPVAGQTVKAVQTGPTVNGQYCGGAAIPAVSTNSTGWVEIPAGVGLPYAGSFDVSFIYSGETYSATVGIAPLTITYLSFYVPSGRTATADCYANCPTSDNSMTMGS